MPDKRVHRGAHPQDPQLFTDSETDKLRQASEDLTWLLNRGYPKTSALRLVGDRFALRERQRIAVMRSTCDDKSLRRRQRTLCNADALDGRALHIDGYNVLTTVEAALANGVLLLCRDGALRDMASMHGTFRRVEETAPAIELVGRTLAEPDRPTTRAER